MSRLSVSLGASADMSAVRQAIESADNNFQELYKSGLDIPQGRLTLVSGTPVMNASAVTVAGHYWTPYTGQYCPIYDGSNFSMVDVGGELFQASTDATKSPAATASASAYDIFVWLDNGVPRATRGPAWSGPATRAVGLTRLRGILVNSAAIVNGPAQYMGTYVGTLYTDGTARFNWVLGSAASGGGSSILKCWNAYNKRQFISSVIDTAAPYTYTTATIRAANTGNNFIEFVMGLAEDPPMFSYLQSVTTAAAIGATAQVGIGDTSTSAYDTAPSSLASQAASALSGSLFNTYNKNSAENFIGAGYAMALEKGDGTNANTFNAGSNGVLTGIFWS